MKLADALAAGTIAGLLLLGVVGFALYATASAPSSPQTTSGWTELNVTGPENLSDYAFAWGTPHDQAAYGLLFGGRHNASAGGHSNQTWILESGAWHQLRLAVNPGALMHPVEIWDPQLSVFVEFGGSTNQYLNTTWEFSGGLDGHWTLVHPATSPPSRRSAAMAYDPNRGEAVVFGGHNSFDDEDNAYTEFHMLNDTWEFNGVTWTNLTSQVGPTAPAPGSEPQLAWDPEIRALIEFGGYNYGIPQHSTGFHAENATWALFGGRWHNLSLAHSPWVRDGAGMVWDPARGGVLLYGGQDEVANPKNGGHGNDNDTWLLSCSSRTTCAWTELASATTPPPVDSISLVWDTQSKRVIFFGGVGNSPYQKGVHLYYFGGTWEFA